MQQSAASGLSSMVWDIVSNNQLQVAGIKIGPSATCDFLFLAAVLALTAGTFSHGRLWDKPDPLTHLWFVRPQGNAAQNGKEEAESRDVAHRMEIQVSVFSSLS